MERSHTQLVHLSCLEYVPPLALCLKIERKIDRKSLVFIYKTPRLCRTLQSSRVGDDVRHVSDRCGHHSLCL